MSCKEIEKQIVLFSELTDLEKERVMKHIKTCAACAELFKTETSTANIIGRASQTQLELTHPHQLTNVVMAIIEKEDRQRASWIDLSFLNFDLCIVKYSMTALSLLLILSFAIELTKAPDIQGQRLVVKTNHATSVLLDKESFSKELSKSKSTANFFLSNNCRSPFNINKIDMTCWKQRMNNN